MERDYYYGIPDGRTERGSAFDRDENDGPPDDGLEHLVQTQPQCCLVSEIPVYHCTDVEPTSGDGRRARRMDCDGRCE